MRRVNGLRADILYKVYEANVNVGMAFSEMVKTVLTTPSYRENMCCSDQILDYPMVYLNNDIFCKDFQNIEKAIKDNFPDNPKCSQCKTQPKYTRVFEQQVFIEVIQHF